ncbi:MAG: DNA polymerase III subunit epsilon [Formosimonas sp.]
MRHVILDTETTGLDPATGHKLVEVGCVEMINRQLTGRHFHHYLNPQRESDEGALAVHGLTTEFLRDKPLFKEIATDLIEFVRGATVLIHNASFDTKFINAELALLNLPPMNEVCEIEDTLRMAKNMFPGKRNNLDALCERLGVSNAHRVLHGALLDAEILAEVYLAMTRGQETLAMDVDVSVNASGGAPIDVRSLDLPLIEVSADDAAAHEEVLAMLGKKSKKSVLWSMD